jgi:hypothetical protein
LLTAIANLHIVMSVRTPAILSRNEAIALGLKRYFTGEPCNHGHIAERNVQSRRCQECAREMPRRWRAARKWRAPQPKESSARLDKSLTRRQAAKKRAALVRSRLAKAQLANEAGVTGA